MEFAYLTKSRRGEILTLKCLPESSYLFCILKGTSYTTYGFNTLWQRLMRKALSLGTLKERFTFHDIRAMAVTHTAEQHGLKAASEAAGHASEHITKRVYIRGIQSRKPTK